MGQSTFVLNRFGELQLNYRSLSKSFHLGEGIVDEEN